MGAVVSLERRLREWIAPQANGCVYYTGHLNTDGYPKTRIDGKLVAVHRKALGEANANARVTADDVRQIRRMAGTTIAIGILFGITSATVSKIKLRRTWRHVT